MWIRTYFLVKKFVHGLFVAWSIHTLDYSSRWTFRTLDDSCPGLFVPSLNDSYDVEN